jgi:hypothetical protein
LQDTGGILVEDNGEAASLKQLASLRKEKEVSKQPMNLAQVPDCSWNFANSLCFERTIGALNNEMVY